MAATALVVDDHPSFRRSARRLLQAAGYEVVGEAGDGRAALTAVRTHTPDVVLLDVLLPDANGFELAEVMAAESPAPAVVLTSSRSAAEYRLPLSRSSARAFIAKPDLTIARLAGLR
jgi:DNA-binding NarL/FixJ family response regulator